MSQLQPSIPVAGESQVELNTQDIANIMDELNRGIDTSNIARRSLFPSQFRVLSYQPNPIKIHTTATLASGSYASVVVNFANNGLTNAVGQTFLPVMYVDLFIDPPDTSSTDNLYANSENNLYPTGSNITTAMANLTFWSYLMNSTPGTDQDVVSYVYQIKNNDSVAHAYWISINLLIPADGNINEGGVANFLT